MSPGRPDFLSIDDKLVALQHGPGAQRSEVAAGPRFAEALAPHLAAFQDARQETLLLPGRAPLDERGTGVIQRTTVDRLGGAELRHLGVENELHHETGGASAEFPRPGDGSQARLVQAPLPV